MPKPTVTPTPYDLHTLFSVLWTSVCEAFVLSTSLATKHDDQHTTCLHWVQMADSTTRSVHNHLHTLHSTYKFLFTTFSLDSQQLWWQPTNQCTTHQQHVQTAKLMAMPAHCHIHPTYTSVPTPAHQGHRKCQATWTPNNYHPALQGGVIWDEHQTPQCHPHRDNQCKAVQRVTHMDQ